MFGQRDRRKMNGKRGFFFSFLLFSMVFYRLPPPPPPPSAQAAAAKFHFSAPVFPIKCFFVSVFAAFPGL